MKSVRYYLGIDGGGTKTEFLLTDACGNRLGFALLGASNPNDIGLDAACALLGQGIGTVTAGYDLSGISVFAGIAGAGVGDHAAHIAQYLRTLGFARADCKSDVYSSLAACLGRSDGIAVIMGTGSVAYARQGDRILRAGGYGYLLGDAGSGFALGRDAILAALQAEDGSGSPTLLHSLVARQCGHACVLDALSELYRGGKAEIARYAPLIFDAYTQKDAVAADILRRNIRAIADLIRAVGARMDKDTVRVCLCGGLIAHGEVILPILQACLAGQTRTYEITTSAKPPIQGALYLAGLTEQL